FDPHGARRAIGIISGCAGAGGLVGGLIAARVGSSLGFHALLAVLIGGALLCALGTFRLGAAPRGAASPPRSIDRAALRSLGGSPYLRSLGLLVVVTGFSGALVDYAFKAAAPRTFHSGPELVRFFTAFYVATSVATVVFQLTVSRQMLDRIGLGGALAALPLAILGFGAVAVVAPTLFTLAALSGAEATLQNSLFRSSYELLYTPLPPSEKRSAKTLIDVACDRFGEAVASGLVLGLLALSPRFVSSMGISIAVIGAGLCLWLSMRLQSSYVSELARSLRNGSVQLDPGGVSDLTTRLTLSQTLTEFDRAELLRQVAEFRARGAPAGAAPAPGAPFAPAIELTSGDAARIRAALTEQPLDPRFSSLVIPLLEIDEVAPAAVTSLQTVGPRISGQLVDALLDQELALKIRRRIPRVLRACHVPRAARGLAEALSDPDFEVRYRSALALHELLDQDEKLRTAPRIVFEAARREIERGESGQSARPFSASDPAPRPHSGFVTLADRRLEHVFTLLGLALDREALALAQQALGRNDEKLRGTALEYLENVVPERVRSVLFPYLEERPRPRPEDGAPPSRRPTPEIIDELKRSVG
ncbi:MAG TPA: Npt1/Npt2 family nucleotide transporter, partial [Polyangiaceae bacterium]